MSCAAIDLTEIGTQDVTPEKWFKGLVSGLVRNFNLGKKFNWRNWWREQEDLSTIQRLSLFIEEVLLVEISSEKLFIFVDEIDNVISLDFKLDDFFALIRFCYNQRARNPEYNRLAFALFGVATPSDLIQDKTKTPFNIGSAIELKGFEKTEAQPLAKGLEGKVENPQKVLKEILKWTGGQPFLTQKLCNLVVNSEYFILDGREAERIKNLVELQVIENWESQDEQAHLGTIRDRILKNEQCASRLLGLYQQILQRGKISVDDSPEHMELRLSGLVVKYNQKLKVYNCIYETIFNQSWVSKQLANLRPYSEAITAWLESKGQDNSRLLRGESLEEALAWKNGKSLSVEDYDFLSASQQFTLIELSEAKQKADQIIKLAKECSKIERMGNMAIRRFDSGEEIEALLIAMQLGKSLQEILKSGYFDNYPCTSPILALQVILDNIREKTNIQAYHNPIKQVCFSPNSQSIATVSTDSTAKLWDLYGNLLLELQHPGEVNYISFSSNGQWIATACTDKIGYLWDLQGNLIKKFIGHKGALNCINFSSDGCYIAIASTDKAAYLWDLQGNLINKFKGHQDSVTSVSFSPNQKYLVTASSDGSAYLWDLQGNIVTKFKHYEDEITNVSFSSNSQYIVTASADYLCLWDVQGNKIQKPIEHQARLSSLSLSSDGEYTVVGCENRIAYLWHKIYKYTRYGLLTELRGHQGSVNSVSFSNSSDVIATATDNGTVHIWSLKKFELEEVTQYSGTALNISFNKLGELYLVTELESGLVNIWNINNGSLIQLKGHEDRVTSTNFSYNEQYIVTASEDCTTKIWSLNGSLLGDLKHQHKVWGVSFSPNGKLLATASDDSFAGLWDLQGNLLTEFKGHQDWVQTVNFSPNNKHLATGSGDGIVRIWDLSGNLLNEFQAHSQWVRKVIFSPDNKYIATTSMDSTARLWDIQGNLLIIFQGFQSHIINNKYFSEDVLLSEEILDISFSPDAQLIATSYDSGTTRLWDLQGSLLSEFYDGRNHHYGRNDSAANISFSHNGKYIARALDLYQDKTIIQLWQVLGLDELLAKGYEWLKYYFASHPEAQEKINICQNK
jgi:WD40 repeat protein